jgi:hypothetical protein
LKFRFSDFSSHFISWNSSSVDRLGIVIHFPCNPVPYSVSRDFAGALQLLEMQQDDSPSVVLGTIIHASPSRAARLIAARDSPPIHKGTPGRWSGFERLVRASGRQRGFGDYFGHTFVARGLEHARFRAFRKNNPLRMALQFFNDVPDKTHARKLAG